MKTNGELILKYVKAQNKRIIIKKRITEIEEKINFLQQEIARGSTYKHSLVREVDGLHKLLYINKELTKGF